jgi:hypothetical protein
MSGGADKNKILGILMIIMAAVMMAALILGLITG